MVETLKKQKDIRGDVKETDKCSWRRESNRQIFVETLKKQSNIQIKKQPNIRGDVKETHKYSTLKRRGDVKETDKYSWRR